MQSQAIYESPVHKRPFAFPEACIAITPQSSPLLLILFQFQIAAFILCRRGTQSSNPYLFLRLSFYCLQEREAKLTHQLKQRLQPYVDGQFDAFISNMTAEADKLSESTFGIPMLKTIG